MTTRDIQLSRHLRANVGKEDDGGWSEKLDEQAKRFDALLDRILAAANSQVDKRHGKTAHEAERRVRDAGKAVIDKWRAEP